MRCFFRKLPLSVVEGFETPNLSTIRFLCPKQGKLSVEFERQ